MFSTDWFSQNIRNWTKWLAEFKGRDNLSFLEIGCFEGRATVWLLENILTGSNSWIHTIDMFEGGMEDGTKGAYFNRDVQKNYNENIKPFGNKVVTYKGKSFDILTKEIWCDNYNFIYIDGSHRSIEVLEDSVLAWKKLCSGGIMVWDDYGLKRYKDALDNPTVGIDAFLQVYYGKYTVISKGYQVCIRKN